MMTIRRGGRGGAVTSGARFLWLGALLLGGCNSLPLERSRDLEVQCRRDLQHAVQLRGLPLNREVAIERESPERLVNSLSDELDKPGNQVFLENTGVLLKQLRVIKKDQDLKALFLKVMGQQVAAYYDPDQKRVAYVEGASRAFSSNAAALPLMDRFVYVHEFCHAVEDSHFDIARLTRASMGDFDRNMALTSLVEGDAMLVGLDSVFAESPANTATPFGAFAVRLMGRMDMSEEVKTMGDCPAFVSGALLRPYLDGGMFSNRLRREAGWQALNDVFTERLPMTTAEILYPERRYLRGFEPVGFTPDPALFRSAEAGVLTNRVGALGMALWLGGDELAQPGRFAFLKGWQGDAIYFLKSSDGAVQQTVWLSYWDRSSAAKSFCRRAEKRCEQAFQDARWTVRRSGRLAAVVWSEGVPGEACEVLADLALKTRVDGDQSPGGWMTWCGDLPWPVRFPWYKEYSCGAEIIGGHVLDVACGDGFSRFNVADGLILRSERNPDRCYWGTLCGLVRYVGDSRSDFTFWRIPLAATWFRRGKGDHEQYAWSVLGGLAAYGSERSASVLLVPVWRSAAQRKPD